MKRWSSFWHCSVVGSVISEFTCFVLGILAFVWMLERKWESTAQRNHSLIKGCMCSQIYIYLETLVPRSAVTIGNDSYIHQCPVRNIQHEMTPDIRWGMRPISRFSLYMGRSSRSAVPHTRVLASSINQASSCKSFFPWRNWHWWCHQVP